MRRLAIIPARGGSKRIPHKNIRNFCGKPIITYVLETARSSNLFSEIHVSTDSKIICEVVTNAGFAPAFLRPEILAEDHTPLMPVLRYVLGEFIRQGQIFDEVWLLMACSPLIEVRDLQAAAKAFWNAGGHRALLAVSEYPAPIEWAYRLEDTGDLVPLYPGMFAKRSQDFEKRYFDSGSFVVFPPNEVSASEGAGSDQNHIGFILPKGSTVDIDDESDWALAERIFRARRKS